MSDAEGYFRLINLPPGTYEVSAQLAGFASFKRQDIIVRAGANFQVDIAMRLASLSESVTVSGESPMLEVSNPSNVLNISGEFQREMPIQARRNWSDFLEITPGVHSRPFDDGSGRMVYFGHSTEHFAHVVQLEGAIASNYQDAQITYVAMGADMVSDTQVKTGGVDASAPMGVGLNINVITKSGGNTFKGSGAFAYQPASWNGDNVANCSPSASCKPSASTAVGTPTTAIIRQFDGGIGGPIRRDKVWFFGSVRRADLEAGISRTAVEVQRLKSFFPNAELFNNTTKSTQPYGKVTMQAGKHQIAAFVQQDRLKATGDREYNFSRTNVYSTGGGLYGGKVTSVWGQRLTTTLLASYNNKGGSDASTFEGWDGAGPTITIHQRGKPHGRTPDRQRPAGLRRELRRRQRQAPDGSYRICPRRKSRCVPTSRTSRTASPDRTSSRPASSGRRAAPTTRRRCTSTTGSSWRNSARSTRTIRRRARFRSTGDMPRRLELTIAHGARQELRGLRAGQLEADAAPDGEPRRPLRLGAPLRQDLRRRPRRRAHRPAPPGLLVPRDQEREERAARQLRPPGRADDGT